MSYSLTTGGEGTVATAQVVWSVDGQTYKFRSDNNFLSWITTIFTVADTLSANAPDYRLLRPTPATDGTLRNVAGGFGALDSNITGANNVALGYLALESNTTGASNTAIGRTALIGHTAGNSNTAVGAFTLESCSIGASNTAVGRSALPLATADSNTAIGRSALESNTTAIGNTAVGRSALESNTTALGNTAVGYYALSVSTGLNNTALGYGIGSALTTGSNNTLIGANANVDTGARSFCVVLGKTATSPAVDGSLAIGGSGGNAMGNLVLGTAGIATGTFLNIYLNGTRYKIALLNP